MLVRPSVTPKDRNDYLAAYSKRYDPDETLVTDTAKSSVRFHPEARHIITDYYSGDGEGEVDSKEEEEEDFPVRRKPVKGRKQTGLPAKLISSSDDCPSVSQAPRHQATMDSDGNHNDTMEPAATKQHKGLSMGMASRIAGAMKKSTKSRRAAESSSHDEDMSINVSTLTIQDSEQSGATGSSSSKKGGPKVMYTPEAFAPVFAEGISLFQPNATYNTKDQKELQKNMKSLPMGKHAFARIVDSARHHKSSSKKEADKAERADAIPEIAPGPRAKLLELAKNAKMKAQQKPTGPQDNGAGSLASRDNEPGWNCAGMDPAALLQESMPLPSLTVQPATPQSYIDREREHRKAHDRAMKKSASRSRLVEQARSDPADDVVWIGRDGQETAVPEERRRHHSQGHRHRSERSRSRHRPHEEASSHATTHHRSAHEGEADRGADDREHRRAHRSRHPEQHHVHHPSSSHLPSSNHHHHHQSSHRSRSSEQLPDKRKGKVLESGAETQRLNLALTMARTRMEMEIAEQQEAKQNGSGAARVEHAVKDDEEKAWLEEAYEEAIKKEVEYQYLYEAHSLGGTW